MRKRNCKHLFLLPVFIICAWMNVSAQPNVFRVNVLHKFSGWAYLVGDTVLGLHKDNIYTLDTNGVAYVEAIGLSQLDNVRVYQDGKEITAIGARLMYSFKLTFPQEHRDIEIPVYYFYVLSDKESNLPDEYWRSDDNTEPLLLKETERRQKLIDAGIIKLK